MLIHADCLNALRTLPANSVDSVVTDPPYGLSFMGKRWDYDVPSGTTAIAAVLEGRDWIGIEREAEYCDIARARIAAAEPQQIEVAL